MSHIILFTPDEHKYISSICWQRRSVRSKNANDARLAFFRLRTEQRSDRQQPHEGKPLVSLKEITLAPNSWGVSVNMAEKHTDQDTLSRKITLHRLGSFHRGPQSPSSISSSNSLKTLKFQRPQRNTRMGIHVGNGQCCLWFSRYAEGRKKSFSPCLRIRTPQGDSWTGWTWKKTIFIKNNGFCYCLRLARFSEISQTIQVLSDCFISSK